VRVDGRSATISLNAAFRGMKISKISTVGKEEPTTAEGLRANIVLKALQRTLPILNNPFVRRIWLPSETAVFDSTSAHVPVSLNFANYSLNRSQVDAVDAVLSVDDADRVVLIHGPPGTGKTTVIAAVVKSIMDSRRNGQTLWLVAQSNVAVKNIAEKLVDVNFLQFKLLISKDFHFDWCVHAVEYIATISNFYGLPGMSICTSR
jgi:Cdc6-like AAA superfamily ATPase